MLRSGNNLLALILLLFAGFGSLGGATRYADDSGNTRLGINRKTDPKYPMHVLMHGIHTGRVSLVISVNAEGTLVDKLVVAYTNEAFVKPVLEALATWDFEPMLVEGVARASRVELTFEFKSDLNVIVNNGDFAMIQDFLSDRYEYRPYTLKELDKIPTPVSVEKPHIPDGALRPGQQRVVTVEFYIDEEGRVRIPAVGREAANDELAASAVAAVEKWRFEPPLRRKQPVLVKATQDFHFVDKAK